MCGGRSVLAVLRATSAETSDDELRKIAGAVQETDKLNRSLVDLLIDKVYVYPDNQIEIVWKVADFFSAGKDNSSG
jgi:hypothetical protein